MFDIHLETLRRRAIAVWGDVGEEWIDQLPHVIESTCRRWGLRLGEPFAPTVHWVAEAWKSDDTACVVKFGPPDGHLDDEALALQTYAGRGAVRLLAFDGAAGALLLERAVPGTPVTDLVPRNDAAATSAIVEVMHRLHAAPLPASGRPLTTQRSSFDRYLVEHSKDDPLPVALVERARDMFDELCATSPRDVMLHGDLHHDNVVRAHRDTWLAIDPHGVIGDAGYECGALLINPHLHERSETLLALLPARIDQIVSELGIPRERLLAWGFVKAVLSSVWSVQGGATERTRAYDVAQLLAPLS